MIGILWFRRTDHLAAGEGYEVHTAAALEALDILKEWRRLLILMDIQLSGIDGLNRRLKADYATHQIILIGLRGAMRGAEERILTAGCEDYIAKPIDTRTLPRVIATLMEKKPDCRPISSRTYAELFPCLHLLAGAPKPRSHGWIFR
jgi:two-component system, cell cycle response regulator DivK